MNSALIRWKMPQGFPIPIKTNPLFLSTEPYISGSPARPPLVPIPVRCSELAHPPYARSDSQQWFAGAGFGRLNGQALSGGVREGNGEMLRAYSRQVAQQFSINSSAELRYCSGPELPSLTSDQPLGATHA
jgi:hypothetical protein